jgi:hypothetical protein
MGMFRQPEYLSQGEARSILMDRRYSYFRYTTRYVEDNKEGSTALELNQTSDNDGNTRRVARIVVWDAFPDFFFETFGPQIPAVVAVRP